MSEKTIELAQFLKLRRIVSSGGEAKLLVQNGKVLVNGELETRRGRKLRPGDLVDVSGQKLVVDFPPEPSP